MSGDEKNMLLLVIAVGCMFVWGCIQYGFAVHKLIMFLFLVPHICIVLYPRIAKKIKKIRQKAKARYKK